MWDDVCEDQAGPMFAGVSGPDTDGDVVSASSLIAAAAGAATASPEDDADSFVEGLDDVGGFDDFRSMIAGMGVLQ